MLLSKQKLASHKNQGIAASAIALLALLLLVGVLALGAPAARAQQIANLHPGDPAATTADTKLLDQPNKSGSLLITLPMNARVQVLGGSFNDGWYWLDYNGITGYAFGTTLVLVDASYRPVSTSTPTKVPTSTPTPAPANSYAGLWLGELSTGAVVRSGPSSTASAVKSWWAGRRVLMYQQVTDSKGSNWVRVSEPPEAPMYVNASLIRKVAPVKFENALFQGKWVNVNLAQQIVTAYQDGVPVKVTLASTGTAAHPTTPGVHHVMWRLTSHEMIGGSKAAGDYYDLPNVPYPQYFTSSAEALHGTYWHDNFGRPMSHGCVNLSTPMSKWFYDWGYVGLTVYVH